MKAGTEAKLKFKALKRRLDLPLWQAIGLLEALWRATEHNAPAGDIGRLTDDEIASAIEWSGPADVLISALVDLHWIDRDPEFRLIIHDWSDHAPNYLKGAFAKHAKQFANDVAKQRNGQANSVLSTMPGHHATNPILSYPIQTNPKPPPPSRGLGGGGGAAADFVEWTQDEFQEIRAELEARKLDRAIAAANDARRLRYTPEAVREILFEYDSNRSKFRGPGAISDRIKNGAWPAAGVLNGEQAAQRETKRAERSELENHKRLLFVAIKQYRAEQLDEAEIRVKLREVLPLDFLTAEGWA